MAVEVTLLECEGIVPITIKAANTIKRGDLIGYNSGWVKADADTAADIFAQYIAMDGGNGSDSNQNIIRACRKAVFYDGDAPYTANTPQYLSGTAGATTETRPATDNDLIQVVGRSLDTYHALVDIKQPQEFELWYNPDTLDTTGEPGLGATDAGWAGPQIDAAAEVTYVKGFLPSGLVSTILVADLYFNSINASALDIDITVVMGHKGASNEEDTGTAITAGDIAQTDADNKIQTMDISACFDTGFYKPCVPFCVKIDPDAITADATLLGLLIRGWKV